MPTITKEFSEIYGDNGPLGKKNSSINNMLKKIVPEKNFINNVVKEYNKELDNPINEKKWQFPYMTIFLLFVIFIILFVLYINRNIIMNYLNNLIKPKKIEDPIKPPITEEPAPTIEEKEEIKKEKNNKIEKGGVHELNKKINSNINYTKEQLVKENGYCYIGYDNGQRECTNVFEGDVCMSGEIFPTLDICINPKLRP